MRGTWRLRQAARSLRSFVAPGALILLYHRVAELPTDPQLLAVTPAHFGEHLEVLRRRARPLSLEQLHGRLGDGGIPRRSVVLTFDDGYADNAENAEPLLGRHDVPATVFVTAGAVRAAREFWWDDLERLLLLPGTLPETLELEIEGRVERFLLGASARYAEADFRRHRSWNAFHDSDPTPRHTAYRSLCQCLRPLPASSRRRVLDELVRQAAAAPGGRPDNRALSPEEVARLGAGGLVEVGAHTTSHPVLSALPPEDQRREIEESRARLEELRGGPVTSFAYPFGMRPDYTPETVAIVCEAGFARACSNFVGLVRPGTDPFQLPRVVVRDWDGDGFAQRLDEWLRG